MTLLTSNVSLPSRQSAWTHDELPSHNLRLFNVSGSIYANTLSAVFQTEGLITYYARLSSGSQEVVLLPGYDQSIVVELDPVRVACSNGQEGLHPQPWSGTWRSWRNARLGEHWCLASISPQIVVDCLPDYTPGIERYRSETLWLWTC